MWRICDHWQFTFEDGLRSELQKKPRFVEHIVGILHAMNACTQNAVHVGAPSIAPANFVRSTRPQKGRLWQRESLTDSECSQTFFLRITLASFAFRRCSLAISRHYPLISHTHAMVLSVPEDEKQHFWFVQACVVLLSREWRIPPVLGGRCSTCLVHLFILRSSCRAAIGDPCQFLAGFCRCCSACECSQRSNGHRRRRQRVASSFQLLSIPIVRCANHPFFGFAHGFLQTGVNSPDRATHISGAGLDCIFISSGHVVWCTMGCNVAQVPLCVAQCWGQTISCASQLVCLFPHMQTQCVDQRCRHCAIGDPL